MDKFKLVAPYKPMGDQIEAIKRLSENIESVVKHDAASEKYLHGT